MNKKAAIQLSFGLMITLVIIIIIAFVGFKGISLILSNFEKIKQQQLIDSLNDYYKQALLLPSNSELKVQVKTHYNKICFYDSSAPGTLNILQPYVNVVNNEDKNVFVLKESKLFPLTHFSLKLSQKEKCFNSSLGYFNFTMISKGDSIDIK